MHIGIWFGNLKERYHFKKISVVGRIILKWILNG